MKIDENDTSPMLTVREASQFYRVRPNTIRRWTNQGILKAYRVCSRLDRRFRAEDIEKLLFKHNKGV